jgi:hypothetical protein
MTVSSEVRPLLADAVLRKCRVDAWIYAVMRLIAGPARNRQIRQKILTPRNSTKSLSCSFGILR